MDEGVRSLVGNSLMLTIQLFFPKLSRHTFSLAVHVTSRSYITAQSRLLLTKAKGVWL